MEIEEVIVNFREQGINQLLAQQKRLQKEITNINTTGQRFAKQQKAVNRLMTGGAQKLIDNSVATQALGKQFDSFRGSMRMGLTNWRKFNMEGGEFNTLGGKLGNRFRMMTHGLRGFRMEMLGVMFFGMGMSKFFTGLLQPAMKLVGMFELFSNTLGILFLPIALALLGILLPIMDWFMTLDPAVQMAIGVFVLFMAILGKVLFLVGMLALGLGSLAIAGITSLSIFGGLFMAVFAPILIIIGIAIAIIILFAIIWKTNFLGMKDLFVGVWRGIVNIFKGAWMIIKGIWDVIAGIFTGDWGRVWKGVKNIFKGAWTLIVKGIGKVVWEIIKFIAMLPVRIAKSLIEFTANLLGAVVWLWNHRGEWIPKVIRALEEAGKKMIEWATNIGESIWGAILGSLNKLKEWGGGIIDRLTGKTIEKKRTYLGGGQTGIPYVPHTGLYKLHAGESVSTAGDTFSSSPTINVYASAGMDVNDLVRQVSEVVTRDLASLSRR